MADGVGVFGAAQRSGGLGAEQRIAAGLECGKQTIGKGDAAILRRHGQRGAAAIAA